MKLKILNTLNKHLYGLELKILKKTKEEENKIYKENGKLNFITINTGNNPAPVSPNKIEKEHKKEFPK